MAADDYAERWLSPSEDPSRKTRIISMNRWTPSRVWEKYPEQKSKLIRLEAGRRYYIEALQMEDTVDDGLAVGWQLPDGTLERPIPGTRLSSPEKMSPHIGQLLQHSTKSDIRGRVRHVENQLSTLDETRRKVIKKRTQH